VKLRFYFVDFIARNDRDFGAFGFQAHTPAFQGCRTPASVQIVGAR
jgi:hypothetical protein